jgi:hypothetical protein
MSPSDTDTTRPTRRTRPSIPLPDGDFLDPRAQFAEEFLKVCDKTAQRMNLLTTYIGNVAYVKRNASLEMIAERVRRPEPPNKKGRRSRHGGGGHV